MQVQDYENWTPDMGFLQQKIEEAVANETLGLGENPTVITFEGDEVPAAKFSDVENMINEVYLNLDLDQETRLYDLVLEVG